MTIAATAIDRFFGEDGAWKEACHTYTDKFLPAQIIEHSKTLGNGRIAFCLGYGFAKALHRRQMSINDAELDGVSEKMADLEERKQFLNGFRRFAS